MENYKLLRTVENLESAVDSLSKEVHNLRQQQRDMIEQIKYLKGKMTDDKK